MVILFNLVMTNGSRLNSSYNCYLSNIRFNLVQSYTKVAIPKGKTQLKISSMPH